jgi:hypothetical protein
MLTQSAQRWQQLGELGSGTTTLGTDPDEAFENALEYLDLESDSEKSRTVRGGGSQ